MLLKHIFVFFYNLGKKYFVMQLGKNTAAHVIS